MFTKLPLLTCPLLYVLWCALLCVSGKLVPCSTVSLQKVGVGVGLGLGVGVDVGVGLCVCVCLWLWLCVCPPQKISTFFLA